MPDQIDAIIKREGEVSNDPNDPGGFTYEGITKRDNPDLFVNGLPSQEQVRQRYLDKYLHAPKIDQISDTRLQAQVLDFAVNSGPHIAISNLQQVLKVDSDGIIGPATLSALTARDPVQVNNLLVGARCRLLARVVQKYPKLLPDLAGLIIRATSFLI